MNIVSVGGFTTPVGGNTYKRGLSNLWGYLATKDDKIRAVIIRELNEYANEVNTPSGPISQFKCPCTKKIWIFLSDPMPINEVLPAE